MADSPPRPDSTTPRRAGPAYATAALYAVFALGLAAMVGVLVHVAVGTGSEMGVGGMMVSVVPLAVAAVLALCAFWAATAAVKAVR